MRRPVSATCCCRRSGWKSIREAGRTIVELLIGVVLSETPQRWQDFVVDGASDVDDARTISLLPSDTHLTLFEREVSKRDHEVQAAPLDPHLARRGQARLRHRADRQRARAFGAHRVLAARGGLLPVADQAGLHLHQGPQVPARVPRARSRDGLRRAARRDHQHEGRRSRPRTSSTTAGCGRMHSIAASTSPWPASAPCRWPGAFRRGPRSYWAKYPGHDGRASARPHGRAAAPHQDTPPRQARLTAAGCCSTATW